MARRVAARAVVAVLLGLVGATLVAPATARVPAPGDPDPSFNGTGARSYRPRGMSYTRVRDVAVQPDGKILLLGEVGYTDLSDRDHDVVVLRVNADGSPDASFGLGGVASIDFNQESGQTSDDYAGGMAVDNAGRIVVVGSSYFDNGGGIWTARPTIARLRSNGSLDPGFSGDGKLIANVVYGCTGGSGSFVGDELADVVVLPDGRIRAVGVVGRSANDVGDLVVLGLRADGERDCDFGSSSLARFDFGGGDVARAVALTSDGGLMVAGDSWVTGDVYRPVLLRLTAAGALAGSFGSGGRWVPPGGLGSAELDDVLVQPDGKTVVAMNAYDLNVVGLIRLNKDGSTDPLGGRTIQTLPTATRTDYAGSVGRDPRGRLLLSDWSSNADLIQTFRLGRFTPDGRPDTSFGVGGVVTIRLDPALTGRRYGVPHLAVQPDGRIVMAGTQDWQFDVRRFLSDPPSDSPSGRAAVSFPRAKVIVKVKRGTWTVRCLNVAGDECRVSLTLKAKKKPKAKVGTATGTIAGGQSGVLTVKLNKTGKRLLGKGRLKVRAVGTSRNRAGTAVPIKQPLTLKGKKS